MSNCPEGLYFIGFFDATSFAWGYSTLTFLLAQSCSLMLRGQHGQALETLPNQDILIIGSGMSFHNMRAYGWLTKAVESSAHFG